MSDSKNKSEVEVLKEKLFNKRINGGKELSEEVINDVDNFCENYKDFLNKSKTEREAVNTAIKLAKEKGFQEFDVNKKYNPGDKVYVNNRGKSVIFTVIGKKGTKEGVKIAAAHIDSPRLDLKPNPLYELSDIAMFKTHYYGGIKKYQWTAIPLSLHGRVVKQDKSVVDIVIGEDDGDPQFCVTDLLPHLGKEQMSKPMVKAIDAESLNIVIGSRPFKSDEGSELVKLNIMKILNEKYGIVERDFLSAELEMVPAFKAKDIGFDKSLIGSYGQDDRVCAYSALSAVLECEQPEKTVVAVLADKEEIGSEGNTGLKSNYLKYHIADLAAQDSIKTRHVLSKSKCLSADVNAAFDPNYASVYEEKNSCYINEGVVVTKYTGSGGKAGTSDASAEFMGEIKYLLDKENVLWQTGELGKTDAGGGGTVAKYIANLNVDVVDLGVPVLSMHSPFELVSKIDTYMTYRAIFEFFNEK